MPDRAAKLLANLGVVRGQRHAPLHGAGHHRGPAQRTTQLQTPCRTSRDDRDPIRTDTEVDLDDITRLTREVARPTDSGVRKLDLNGDLGAILLAKDVDQLLGGASPWHLVPSPYQASVITVHPLHGDAI